MLAGLIGPMLSMEMISPGKRSGCGLCGASCVSVSLSLSEGASGGSVFGSLLYIGGGRSCRSGVSVGGFGSGAVDTRLGGGVLCDVGPFRLCGRERLSWLRLSRPRLARMQSRHCSRAKTRRMSDGVTLVLSQHCITARIILSSLAWNRRLWSLLTRRQVDRSSSCRRALYACSSSRVERGSSVVGMTAWFVGWRSSCSRARVESGICHDLDCGCLGKRREYELW